MFKVKFVVQCKTKKGEQCVKIVGNLPSLGSWNPANGLPMEEYYDGEWQSARQLQIPNGQQFEFKVVKIFENNRVQWEELPNNANRKFRPKFNAKLILTWSNNMGQALNEAKSSLKLNGMPGVMVKGNKGGGMLKRKPIKKNIQYDSSDSENEPDNDSFCNVINRKKSSDIRDSINMGDIEEMYYETTELQNAYHNYKKIQVNLVCNSFEENKQFFQKIEEQVKDLFQLENIHFKWLFLDDHSDSIRTRKLSFKKVESLHDMKVNLEHYIHKNVQKNHFIFVSLQSALNTQIGSQSACLYLPSSQFEKVTKDLRQLQKFQFICFDKGQTNKQLCQLIGTKKKQIQITELQKQKHSTYLNQMKAALVQKKQFENINLEKVVEELEYCTQSVTNINTVHSFTKNEALKRILESNSVLFIDSELLKADKKFFQCLIDSEIQKRMVIIIHKGGMADWMQKFKEIKSIYVVLQNFTKLYFLGKLYDPIRRHRNVIQFMKMRAKLCQQQIGGTWSMTDEAFIYNILEGTQAKFQAVKNQIENILKKDYDYFKMTMKEHRIKITWNLSHEVRLLRTLLRIKTIQQGQIGNFYLVAYKQNFDQLKEQITLAVNANYYWMLNGKHTKVTDFGYGQKSVGKYNIKVDDVKTVDSSQSASSKGSQKNNEQSQKQQKESVSKEEQKILVK